MTEGMYAHLSLCNKLPQNVMPNNSNSFIISPHTIGWLGSAGWFYCCSHLRSATVSTARWWWGCTPMSCASEGVAGAWALPGHLHVSLEHPLLYEPFPTGQLNFPQSCSGLPNHTTAIDHFCLVTGSLRESLNQCSGGQHKDIDFRDLVHLWRLATTSSNIKLNTLIFCSGKNLSGGVYT